VNTAINERVSDQTRSTIGQGLPERTLTTFGVTFDRDATSLEELSDTCDVI
jgi:hypothetical protein